MASSDDPECETAGPTSVERFIDALIARVSSSSSSLKSVKPTTHSVTAAPLVAATAGCLGGDGSVGGSGGSFAGSCSSAKKTSTLSTAITCPCSIPISSKLALFAKQGSSGSRDESYTTAAPPVPDVANDDAHSPISVMTMPSSGGPDPSSSGRSGARASMSSDRRDEPDKLVTRFMADRVRTLITNGIERDRRRWEPGNDYELSGL